VQAYAGNARAGPRMPGGKKCMEIWGGGGWGWACRWGGWCQPWKWKDGVGLGGGGVGDNSGTRGFGPDEDRHGGRSLDTVGGCGNWESGDVHDSENNESIPVNGRRHQRRRGGRTGARHRRIYVQGPPMILEGNDDSNLDYYYYDEGMGDSNSVDGDVENPLSVKHLYCSSIWEKSHIKNHSKPKEFSSSSWPRGDFPRFPTFLKLFKLFWPDGPVLLR
jgi:hypothetical protein